MEMEDVMLEGAAGAVVTPETETEEGTGPAEGAEGEQGSGAADRTDGKQTQTHEERVRYSAARRQGERTGQERAAKEANARIAKTGLIDPITQRPITNLEELEAYGQRFRQQRIETRAREEKKTVAQIEEEEAALELLAAKRREDGERAKEEENRKKQQEWLQQDAELFREAFPDVDLIQLEKDKKFVKFCGKRLGTVPVAELYADYLDVVGGVMELAEAKRQGKAERGTGSGGGAGGNVMTAGQRAELEAWNEANPHLKMSEKEFLKYRS